MEKDEPNILAKTESGSSIVSVDIVVVNFVPPIFSVMVFFSFLSSRVGYFHRRHPRG